MSVVYVLLKKKVSQGVRVSTHEIVSDPLTNSNSKKSWLFYNPTNVSMLLTAMFLPIKMGPRYGFKLIALATLMDRLSEN